MVPPQLKMKPVEERDLPLLELIAAAPRRRIPEEKIEAIALVAAGRRLLRSGAYLDVSPPNGHRPHLPDLQGRALSAASYRCLFFSPDGYALAEEGELYLNRLGLEISDETKAEVAALIARPEAELEEEAARLWAAA